MYLYHYPIFIRGFMDTFLSVRGYAKTLTVTSTTMIDSICSIDKGYTVFTQKHPRNRHRICY